LVKEALRYLTCDVRAVRDYLDAAREFIDKVK